MEGQGKWSCVVGKTKASVLASWKLLPSCKCYFIIISEKSAEALAQCFHLKEHFMVRIQESYYLFLISFSQWAFRPFWFYGYPGVPSDFEFFTWILFHSTFILEVIGFLYTWKVKWTMAENIPFLRNTGEQCRGIVQLHLA